jgi:hypothetical protein
LAKKADERSDKIERGAAQPFFTGDLPELTHDYVPRHQCRLFCVPDPLPFDFCTDMNL